MQRGALPAPRLGALPARAGTAAPRRRVGGVTALARRVGRGEVHALAVADAAARPRCRSGAARSATRARSRSASSRATDAARPDSYDVVERLWHEAERERPGADLLQKMTYLELKQRLAELLLMRVDKMTMATSVEARVPFLDHELVEFAMALPPEMKVRDGVGKYLLKRAVSESLLPENIVYRQKQGFGAPVAEWFQGELGRRAQAQINGVVAARARVARLRRDRPACGLPTASGPVNWAFHLWNLYNVSAWYDYWVAGPAQHLRAVSTRARDGSPRGGASARAGDDGRDRARAASDLRERRRAWLRRRPLTVGPGELHAALGGDAGARAALRGRVLEALPTVRAFEGSSRHGRRRPRPSCSRSPRTSPRTDSTCSARARLSSARRSTGSCDFKSGRSWPLDHISQLRIVYPDASDIKVPWELSRFQHLPLLAAAYRLTG